MGKTFSGKRSLANTLARGGAKPTVAPAPAVSETLKADIFQYLSFKTWTTLLDLKINLGYDFKGTEDDLRSALQKMEKSGRVTSSTAHVDAGGSQWKRK